MNIARRQAFFSEEQKDFVIHCNKSMVRVIIFWGWFSDLQYPQFDAQELYLWQENNPH